jgi:hypothetical protein
MHTKHQVPRITICGIIELQVPRHEQGIVKRLRWSGACSKVVEVSASAVRSLGLIWEPLTAGSDDPWRFI